jgi:hypothetical protein
VTSHLEAKLLDFGIACRVEVRDRLAVVVPVGELAVNADVRAGIVSRARAEGFTHVAVEIDPDRAPLSGD